MDRSATRTTPQSLIAALLDDDAFRSVSDIARASGWNYQRLQRWYKGSVGDISPDDMADLLTDLELAPEDFGVSPSLAWRRKHATRPLTTTDPGGPIAILTPDDVTRLFDKLEHIAEQQATFQKQVLDALEYLKEKTL